MIIAIFHPAGGVGKTTTALNLGYALATQGKRVLLCDLDPQSDLSGRLDIAIDKHAWSLARVLAGGKGTPTVVGVRWQGTGFDVVPGTLEEMSGLDLQLASVQKREERLTRALAPLQPNYDYILLDCPPNLTLLGINALYAADTVLVPVQAQDKAVRQLYPLFQAVEEVRAYRDGQLPRLLGILPTMVDTRTRQSKEAVNDLWKTYPDAMFSTAIPDRTELQNDSRWAQPIGVYAPTNDAAVAYARVAEEVIGHA